MERREHYDPEDIESLLQERGFDELLEEERAYVLRHLSGREEYETMRSLLHQVREDDRRHGPVTAAPEVRDAVMAAFRAQQRPQWQVWLNSLGGLLWPKEVSASPLWWARSWRPALAIASLALLIVAGVRMMDRAPEGTARTQVAEAKPAAPTRSGEKATSDGRANMPAEESPGTRAGRNDEQPGVAGFRQGLAESDAEAAAPPPPPMTLDMEEDANAKMEREARADGFVAEDGDDAFRKAGMTSATPSSGTFATGTSHQVTEQELARNQSVANATGEVARRVAEKRYEATLPTTTLSGSPELLALLNTGW